MAEFVRYELADGTEVHFASPVRVQWDPERDLRHAPLAHRSIQIGLSSDAVRRYVDEWIVTIEDVTPLMSQVGGLVAAGQITEAAELVPEERPYPLPGPLRLRVGAS